MSQANPTPIRLGMTGTFDGRTYRVAGRVVMSMDDNGTDYYWNEFNLVSNDGNSATLVYEETESGGQWRLFTLFEPEFPMTAADAATKKVGDRLNLDGRDVRVTLVDESHVYYIEGEAPEGVEVNDIAHYFNAETANRMLVVSWTGDEVEYYRGITFAATRVAVAFKLPSDKFVPPRESLSKFAGSFLSSGSAIGDQQYLSTGAFVKMVAVALAFVLALVGYYVWRGNHPRGMITKKSAPTSSLALGDTGTLRGKTYRIQSHAVVECAEVGRLYDRHEYQLLDDDGNRLLLVYGTKPGEKDCILFTPLQGTGAVTPDHAGALRLGDKVNLDDKVGTVRELSQNVVRQLEGNAASFDLRTNALYFSVSAEAGNTPLFIRWDANRIQFYTGVTVLPSELEAFRRKSAG